MSNVVQDMAIRVQQRSEAIKQQLQVLSGSPGISATQAVLMDGQGRSMAEACKKVWGVAGLGAGAEKKSREVGGLRERWDGAGCCR